MIWEKMSSINGRMTISNLVISLVPYLLSMWYVPSLVKVGISSQQRPWNLINLRRPVLQICSTNISPSWIKMLWKCFLSFFGFWLTVLDRCRIHTGIRDIQIECSKQFKWNSYFYGSRQNRLFWAALKTALKFKYEI